MKNILALILLVTSFYAYSAPMRVMTFNTTCFVCNKGKYDSFDKRKHWIVDTIERANPDLIGMQEVFLPSQLHWFKKKLKDYYLIYSRKWYIFRYTDPALFIKKDRFKIKKWGGFWLGPLGRYFSFGWKIAIPRRIQWTRVEDRLDGQQYFFVSSHFDNSEKNKEKSARIFTKAFDHLDLPVIFAADTNLKPKMSGYAHIRDFYYDSFHIKDKMTLVRNSDTNIHHSCNIEKAKVFPDCRVDHIFLDRKHEWNVSDWVVDQYIYGKKKRFNSDHRALYADIELK